MERAPKDSIIAMHPSLDLSISKILALVRFPVPSNVTVGYVDGAGVTIVEVVSYIEEVGGTAVALDGTRLTVPKHVQGGSCGNEGAMKVSDRVQTDDSQDG